MDETEARDAICRFGRSLFERGLTPGSSGNISYRLDDARLICTPTNASLGSLDPSNLSIVAPDGRLLSGSPPTKEMPLHTALYDTRKRSRAIVHLHSVHSVAVSMLPGLDPDDVLPPLTPYYLMRVGRTVLLPYYSPGDPAVGNAIRGLAGKYASILLSNHGPVIAGDTLEGAIWSMEELEATAQLHLLTLGREPRLLPDAEVARLRGDL